MAKKRWMPLLVVVFAASSDVSFAAGCEFERQGDGVVSGIIDGRTIRLDDGREVRLAGIEPLPMDADISGTAALTALIAGRAVTLRGETDMPDRYGLQPAFVFTSSDTVFVQGRLLTEGAALNSVTVTHADCARELSVAEAAARAAKRGIWANSAVIKNAESPDGILAGVGQFTLVEGKVLSVREAGATTYINFGRRWTQDFAVTISRRMLPVFEAAGMSPKALEGRRLRVRGFVERHGGPRIEAHRVTQIEVLGDNETIRR